MDGENNQSSGAEDALTSIQVLPPWLSILLLLVAVVGFLSNILVCATILKVRFLHDVTHYLILNLAVSDALCCLMYALNTVLDLLDYPHNGTSEAAQIVYCHLMYGNYLFQSFAYISAYNLVIISLERYVGIVYPLQYIRICTKGAIRLTVFLAWFLGFCPYMIHLFGVQYIRSRVKFLDRCFLDYHAWEWHFLPFAIGFVAPLVTMIWAYTRIIRTLKQSMRNQGVSAQAEESRVATRRVVHLMLTVTITYAVLYIPTQPAYMIILIVSQQRATKLELLLANLLSKLPVLLNSVINPFIYAFKYKKFRKGVRDIACRCLRNTVSTCTNNSLHTTRQNSVHDTALRLQKCDSYSGNHNFHHLSRR